MIDDCSLLSEVRGELMVLEGLHKIPSISRARGWILHSNQKLEFGRDVAFHPWIPTIHGW